MIEGIPLVTCCGLPLVWVLDETFSFAECVHCGRFFSSIDPESCVSVRSYQGHFV